MLKRRLIYISRKVNDQDATVSTHTKRTSPDQQTYKISKYFQGHEAQVIF